MGEDYRKTNKPSDIRRALLKKGFREDQTKVDGHTAYVITGGTGKEIYTFMSRGGHGKAALSEKLLHDMSRQLSFQNYADFQRFVSCTLSEDDYRNDLSSRGLLNRRSRIRRPR